MNDSILFTRLLTIKDSHGSSDEEILQALEDSVRTFLDSCNDASLVSIESREFREVDKEVDQPFIRVTVEYNNSIEQDLIHPQVSSIGTLSQFDDCVPIRLFGPSDWINKSGDTVNRVKVNRESENQHIIDRIANMFFDIFN